MANGFVKNAHRYDPYKTYKFQVAWEGKVVLGVNKVGALKWAATPVTYRSGGDDSWESKSPGQIKYDAITLERGITHDPAFSAWASQVHAYASGDRGKAMKDYKKELELTVMNEAGQPAIRYFLHRCWVSEFTTLPQLDATANSVAVESIKIELEGWEPDTGLKEPTET
jgi:phage tail-like protein